MGTGYEPLNVLKPIGRDIWIVDGPAIRFYGLPFSTRMTVVRLENGDLWLHSPIAFDEGLASELQALGPIKHLIAPNWIHYACIADWQKACAAALSWAAPGVAQRAASRGVEIRIDYELGKGAEEAWRSQIGQLIAEGSKVHREAVFFHHASATLTLTDLIENFEAAKVPWWMGLLGRLAGIMAPNGQMPRDMRMTFRGRHDELRAAVHQMIDWAPERIIIAHGKCFEQDAASELRRAFAFVLN